MSRSAPRTTKSVSEPVSLAARIRIVRRLLALLLSLIACVCLYYLWFPFARRNPWPRTFLDSVARIAGVRVHTEGKQPNGQLLLLANHVTWIDIPALAGATGSAFVAHEGLTANFAVHWLASLNDTIFIARDRRASISRQIGQISEAMRETGALTIFPEGTTSDGTGLLPFKSSLLSAFDPGPEGIAIQPVWLDYASQVQQIAWVGSETGCANFLRILARKEPIDLTLHFLTPLEGEALSGRKTMAAAAQAAILEKMDETRRARR